jgi:hypothetical protein
MIIAFARRSRFPPERRDAAGVDLCGGVMMC